MTWWLIPLILAVIGAGFLGGLKVSSILLRRPKRGRLNAFSRGSTTRPEKRASMTERAEPSQTTSILDIAQTLLINPAHDTAEASQETRKKEPLLNDLVGAGRNSPKEEQPLRSITNTPEASPEKDRPFNNNGGVLQKLPAMMAEEITPDVEASRNAAITELEQNLMLAEKPLNGTLYIFQTDVWDNRRSEFDAMDPEIKWQITQAYTDMFLANNIVRLSSELGGDSEHMVQSYLELKSRIAECLRRVSPAVPRAFRS